MSRPTKPDIVWAMPIEMPEAMRENPNHSERKRMERVLLPSGRIAGVVNRNGDVLTVRILGRSKMTFDIKACHVRPWHGGVSQ